VAEGTHSRGKDRRLAIFNHKGGVGKTTLTMNIGTALGERGHRVLLVDTDPQCNLTSYLVEGEVVDDLLDHSDGSDGQTVWSAVKPISEALGDIKIVEPIELDAKGVHLVPGDIRLAEFEADLNDFWAKCLQRKPQGFRGTTAISRLVDALCEEMDFDFVLYDSGPNIGSLNRAILLDCNEFIVPVACDLFSLRALRTLGRTLYDWISSWSTIRELAPADMPVLPGRPAFLGYIPERFRTYAGSPTYEASQFLAQIDKEIRGQVVALLRELDPALIRRPRSIRLGSVKDFGQLVPASQRSGRPLYAVDAGSPAQRDEALEVLSSIAATIDETKL
jgi:cellulose biosynthesis protein BcsQ